jgi:predicted DCC family thiol-disulfide oxidoreductase YuxK
MLTSETDNNQLIILFDGVCNLCSSSVQFVIKHDKKKQFRFASLQSAFGQKTLSENNLSTTDLSSFILLENGKLYTKSTGALRVVKRLGGAWPLLYGFIIVPPFLRNAVYNWVAKNRYKWFGKQESCWLPTPELKARFIN